MPTEALTPERDEERLTRLPSDDGLAFHRVSGEGHRFDVAYLQEGLDVARTVACVRVTDRLGREVGAATGVMVSPRLLLTVAHALPHRDAAAHSSVWFDYERDENGVAKTPRIFRLDPDAFFFTDPELDFTLVAVEPIGHDGTSVTEFGSVVLMEDTPKVGSREKLHVVEYPQGGFKQLGLHSVTLQHLFDDFAHFGPGAPTSGAAVFNDQWELVALAHAGVFQRDAEGRVVDRNGNPWDPSHGDDAVDWPAFEGVRISRICESLLDEMWTEDEQDFLDEVFDAEFDDFEEEEYDDMVVDDESEVFVGEGDHDGEPMPATATLETQAPPDLSLLTPPPLPVMNEETPPEPEPAREPSPEPGLPTENPPEVQPIPEHGPDLVPSPEPEVPPVPQPPDLIPNPVPEIIPPVEPAPSHEPLRGNENPLFDGPVNERNGLRLANMSASAYSHLAGFDEGFLGERTPLPRMLPALKQQVAKSNQGIEVLDYTHFSVVVNGRRRVAFFVAANLNPSASGGSVEPVWLTDSRLDSLAQIDPEILAESGQARVQWVQPAEVAWGEQSSRAATDAYHLTNCALCPSAAYSEVWKGLVGAAVQGRRACLYAGPIMQPGDPVLRGFPIPMEMWRIIVTGQESGGLMARGFRQVRKLGTDQYETHQCRVSEIESLTGLDFGPLRLSDPMAQSEGAGRLIGSLAEV